MKIQGLERFRCPSIEPTRLHIISFVLSLLPRASSKDEGTIRGRAANDLVLGANFPEMSEPSEISGRRARGHNWDD